MPLCQMPQKLRLILMLSKQTKHVVKKKVLMLGSKEIDTIYDFNIYGTYKDLKDLSEEEHEKKLFQGIQSANGLKDEVGKKG